MCRKAKCHPNRDLYVKEMCKSCYDKDWYKRNPGKARQYYLKYMSDINNRRKRATRTKLWRARNPRYKEWQVESNLKHKLKKFSLTRKDYEERLGHGCGICGVLENLCFDHCHETRKFRGLLCQKCNKALGVFGDNLDGIEKVVAYLSGETNEEIQ